MLRRRQVRLSYPREFVELALLLSRRHGRRRCARALGLPLSTIYRWLEERRHQPERLACVERSGLARIGELVAACAAHGFDLRERIATLEPLAADPRLPGASQDSFQSILNARTSLMGELPAPATLEPARRLRATPLSPSVRARLASARNEIDRRYYSQLSCEMLAGLAGMSRFHFIRTFKAAFCVSPYRYLMQVRIRHAKRLLSTTRQPLDAVAAAVGFDTQSSLCKAFRSVEGVSLATFFHGVRLGWSPSHVLTPARGRAAIG